MKRDGIRLRPTGLWLIFGPVLGCMWVAAVNNANNLIYAILYLIASLTLVSVFQAWRNLSTVEVEHIRIHPAFAGEEVHIDVHLRNSSQRTVYGLFLARLGDEAGFSRRLTPLYLPGRRGLRINGGDSCLVQVAFPTERRGMYRFESLLVRTSYPMGLFWAGFRVPVNAEYFIYPQPKGTEEWPGLRPGSEQGAPVSNRPGDDFAGVRAYMPGESLRHVDWKAYARGRPLSVKQFTGGAGQELWLDAAEMAWLPIETRLSQLALWIVNAEKEEIPYALRLGRTILPLGLGEAHSRRALEALAVAGVGS